MNRPANITPSGFAKVMTGSRGKSKFGKTATSYAEEIVQLMIGVPSDDYTSYEMQWGIDHEPLAIKSYEKYKMVEVQEKSRIEHPEYDFISGEPDGLIGTDGIIEVKCPNSNNHFKNLLNGEQITQYRYQIQGYLWLTERKWCDFVSFDPRYPDKYQLSVNRVVRDDAMIEELEERCIDFWNELVLPIRDKIEQL
ncbi:lambda exonuclease family protein [Gracilimonas sp.]|uniref:lambda exonuclease family protein n=1 Tax=Gracilimonas sp. TaxID=1974203 RepID=UPI0028721DC9|nr:YqaJ viral recombinase family protein [Gracilimonas sp.]